MTITKDALAGKIVKAPLNGTPTFLNTLPEGMTPIYSGSVLILAGEQVGDTNLTIKSEFKLNIKGDAVVLSQGTWHALTGA